MILTAVYNIELNNGRIGTREGPIYVPDDIDPVIEPMFETKTKKVLQDKFILHIPEIGPRIIKGNIQDFQSWFESKKPKTIGFHANKSFQNR